MVTIRPKTKLFDEVVRHVFYEGETVRSRYHGLGEVTTTGQHPRVRFLDGQECHVPADTLRFVPLEVYDAEVENRMMIERYLTFRTCGTIPSHTASLPRAKIDLAAAMKRHVRTPPLACYSSARPTSSVLYFP